MSPKSSRKNIQNNIPLFLAGAGLALLALAAFLFLRPPPQPPAATQALSSQHSGEDTFPEISRVTLADSKTALDGESAIFIDVRDTSAYAEAHIPGALSIPLAELEERLGELNPSQWIITYCT